MKTIEMAYVALMVGTVALVACASEPGDGQAASDTTSASGGYTGLGKYTGVSGVYGNGQAANGGTSWRSTTTNSTAADSTAAGSGGSTDSGEAVATEGGAQSTDATSGGRSSGPMTGGTSSRAVGASGGRANQSGGTNSLSIGGQINGNTSSASATSNGGNSNGGAGGTVTTRDSTATGNPFSWPGSYNPAGVPSNPSGKHSPGANCMGSSCHASNQASRAFAFGGTIYQPGGTNPAANVQIAISVGSTTVTTYSGTNGNFWLPLSAAGSINWSNATVHVRNGKGELAKPSTASVNAGCNSCHGSSMRITAP